MKPRSGLLIYGEGEVKFSGGKMVTGRKQSVAIALSEAREAGAKIPKKKKPQQSVGRGE